MEFRRVLFRSSAGEGGRIERASDGTVGVSPVKDDLSGVARFTGETASGSLGTGGSETYAFTIRVSEMAGTQGDVGKASDRDRVCQYVYHTVVPGYLNKKQQHNEQDQTIH